MPEETTVNEGGPSVASQTSGLPDDIIEAIAVGAETSIGGQPAMLANLALGNVISNINLLQQNAVANQQALNQVLLAVTGKLVNVLVNLSPLEAAAFVKSATGDDVAQQLADLKATSAASDPAPAPPTPEGGDAGGAQ